MRTLGFMETDAPSRDAMTPTTSPTVENLAWISDKVPMRPGRQQQIVDAIDEIVRLRHTLSVIVDGEGRSYDLPWAKRIAKAALCGIPTTPLGGAETWRHADGSIRVDHMDARDGDYFGGPPPGSTKGSDDV